MDGDLERLALEIARCPIIDAVLRGEPSPCREVVGFQKRNAADRWVAEPWSGHLDIAPILFVSSNPSSGNPDEHPVAGDLTASSTDNAILNTFDKAFEPGPWFGIHDGTHLRAPDGTPGKYISYWGSCKSRASELVGRPARPGLDYALTEVVHCGSQHEIGVWPAASVCVPRYLERILIRSPAAVVVVVGSVARGITRTLVPALAGDSPYVGPVIWAGRNRHVLFVPHPNARGVPKGIAAFLGAAADHALSSIRAALPTDLPGRPPSV